MVSVEQEQAESYLESGDFTKAHQFYLAADMQTQAAFALVLKQDLAEAKQLYEKVPDSLAKTWGLFLCDFLSDDFELAKLPGFLTVRLFFESTLTYFIRFKIDDYFERIIEYLDDLEVYYPELSKFIGSAYLGLNDLDNAKKYLDLAIKKYPDDAEVQYKLGEVFLLSDKKQEAKAAFKKVLRSIPGHRASQIYLEKL